MPPWEPVGEVGALLDVVGAEVDPVVGAEVHPYGGHGGPRHRVKLLP